MFWCNVSTTHELLFLRSSHTQDGAYWSALEGTGIKCTAQGAAGAKVVQAQITCVPATGREVYYVQESAGRKGGYPDIKGKVGQISASCRTGYKAIACNCIRSVGDFS